MARYKKGILGPVSGTVGTVVGGSWKGIDYVRSLPTETANFVGKKIFRSGNWQLATLLTVNRRVQSADHSVFKGSPYSIIAAITLFGNPDIFTNTSKYPKNS